jgi:hypothetical protein
VFSDAAAGVDSSIAKVGDQQVPMALLRDEPLVRRRREATELSPIRPGGADAHRHHVALDDERLDRHLKLGELRSEPPNDLPRVRRTMDPARLFAAEGRDRVLHVLLGHDFVCRSEIPRREDLLEETLDQHPSNSFHHGPLHAWPVQTRRA